MSVTLARRVVAEGIGTSLLVAAVVGSGIMGDRLDGGNEAIALLANTLATGAALLALILTFGPISGAHLNPLVTIADATQGGVPWRHVAPVIGAQLAGGVSGTLLAHVMFALPLVSARVQPRTGAGIWIGEVVATFGLVGVIWVVSRRHPTLVSVAVAAYISAAYWFTSSTSFANPAVTLGRAATGTFSGIRVADVPAFIAAQAIGAALATILFRWLAPARPGGAIDSHSR